MLDIDLDKTSIIIGVFIGSLSTALFILWLYWRRQKPLPDAIVRAYLERDGWLKITTGGDTTTVVINLPPQDPGGLLPSDYHFEGRETSAVQLLEIITSLLGKGVTAGTFLTDGDVLTLIVPDKSSKQT